VKRADTFAPQCMARRSSGSAPMSEDCLFLNIWTPAAAATEKLPVLVWIHGGAWLSGTASESVYDGTALAKQGVIVVTVDYRLSVFGFLAHPLLREESPTNASGNYGLMDLVSALQWVKRNIAAFGGDPARVTIAGESAGSLNVSALLAAPSAQGLFQQAIGQSGAYFTLPNAGVWLAYRREAENKGEVISTAVGAKDLAALRAAKADDLIKAVGQIKEAFAFQPIIDGEVLPRDVAVVYLEKKEAKVPLLVGWNSDEGVAFVGPQPPDAAGFAASFTRTFGDSFDVAPLKALYPATTPAEIGVSERKLAGDPLFNYPTWKWAETHRDAGAPVYVYSFERVVPPAPGGIHKGLPMETLGATHASEVPYMFGNLDGVEFPYSPITTPQGETPKYQPMDRELSRTMVGYWSNFVKTGNPNGAGLPQWPRYDDKTRPVLHLAEKVRAGADDRVNRMRALDTYFIAHRVP
jgi:para-nitrobenzyl esterase